MRWRHDNGAVATVVVELGNVSINFAVAGTGDFDSDGDADIAGTGEFDLV